MKKGFDNQLYVKMQTEKILERIRHFGNKLYLEFGGKLFDDYHAARVLPGFNFDAKIKLLKTMKDMAEVIFVISAGDIERNKMRADFGITYGEDIMRQIDLIRSLGISVNSVCITQYAEQPAASVFINKLQRRGENTYIHRFTKGYPTDVDTIVSDEGYGANPYIETKKPLVVVTAPGPGSGKLATCLSQLYHEYKRGVKAGYAKFETFPIWNLPLKHPVNVAYEAATADLKDMNMIDPFHLEAYGVTTVNYNRDVECFPLLKNILAKITGEESLYASPTDMGVNMAGFAIVDDEAVRVAARQEIIRRYYKCACDYKSGLIDLDTAQRVELLMKEQKITTAERSVVAAALEKSAKCMASAMAVELSDGKLITGKAQKIMTAGASTMLNALKVLSHLDDDIHLLAPNIIEPMLNFKKTSLGYEHSVLNVEEVLLALSISAATNSVAEKALSRLNKLRGCEAHSSDMISQRDEAVFRKLGINVTCEPVFPSKDLFTDK